MASVSNRSHVPDQSDFRIEQSCSLICFRHSTAVSAYQTRWA